MRLAIEHIARRATGWDARGHIEVARLTRGQLARWRRLVADDDPATFARRIAWDDAATAPTTPSAAGWTELLLAISAAARTAPRRGRMRHERASAPQPFQVIYRPFVQVACAQLARAVGSHGTCLGPAAYAALEHALLVELAAVGHATLAHEAGSSPRAFESAALADGLARLLRGYPVLARLLATICAQWIRNTAELIERIAADRLAVAAALGDSVDPGVVRRIAPALGDRHRDGRTVCALTFASGLRVVYKPRPLELEVAFGAFLAWCNAHSGPLDLRAPRIVARDGYGWVEYVAPAPCRTRAEVVRFHERAGMLLAICYLLGESDCHSGNLIAAGEYPIPLDTETLLRPESPVDAPRFFDHQAPLAHDVARTGLLPFWARSRADGGISNVPLPEGAIAGGAGPRPHNQPRLGRSRVASAEHVDDVARGYDAMIRSFIRHRCALRAVDGPLAVFAAPHAIRYIARGTGIYELLQRASYHPDYLRDGRDRAIFLDAVARRRLGETARPATWPIAGRERAALERLDVPVFHATPIDRTLRLDGGGAVPGVFAAPGLEVARQRLDELDGDDRARQQWLIRAHFACFTARPPRRKRRRTERWPASAPASPRALIARARQLGDELAMTALPARDGAAAWLAPELSDLGRYQLMRLGNDYGGGAAGIALFLAALARVTGDDRHATLVDRALAPARSRQLAPSDGLRGVAATIYALTVAGELRADDRLHADAQRLCDQLTPAHIAADRTFDVVGGSAGLILAVLALHRRTREPGLLALGRELGDHLLTHRLRSQAGPRVWQTPDGIVGVGLLHGQSGFGLALARLGAVLDDARYRAAAAEAFAYERVRYSPRHRAWFDGRPRSYPGSLCKGAAGILLARVGSLAVLDDPALRADCETAVDACTHTGMLEIDHLCCGNAGRLEAEALAADALGRPALRTAAVAKASALVARAEALGGFSLLFPDRAIAHPSLYVGLAGVGYTLLRLAAPDRLPAVVLWD